MSRKVEDTVAVLVMVVVVVGTILGFFSFLNNISNDAEKRNDEAFKTQCETLQGTFSVKENARLCLGPNGELLWIEERN